MADGDIIQGPADAAQCPRIVLKGNAYQRGVQYGKAFKKYLPAYYDRFVKKPAAQVLTAEYCAILKELENTVRQYHPQFFDELKGRSDGAGMDYDACRILAFHSDIRPLLNPGCSNVLTTRGPDGPWLARTCDLFEPERAWQVLVVCFADDCLSYAGTGFLGRLDCIGVNSAGLAVGGSSSSSSAAPSRRGLANAPLVMLATLKTTAECCRLAREVGLTGKGANLPLLDASGDAAMIEYAPGLLAIRRPDDTGFLACANYSITGKIPPSDAVRAILENSRARYDHLCKKVGQVAPERRPIELAKRVLADHDGEHHVCQHIPGSYHTIYSWIIRPGAGRSELHFNWGYPCQNRYERLALDWKTDPF